MGLFFALDGDTLVARDLERTAGRRQRDQNRAAANQRHGDSARLEAKHPNGILNGFYIFFVLRKRDREDGDGEEYKRARDCR